MGAVYLFGEALSAAQILAIYQLGPGYQVGKTQNLLSLGNINIEQRDNTLYRQLKQYMYYNNCLLVYYVSFRYTVGL